MERRSNSEDATRGSATRHDIVIPRFIRRTLWLLLLWSLLIVAFSALSVVESKRAFAAAEEARRSLSIEDLATETPERHLREMARHGARARRALRNPLTLPATVLPVAGRQLRSAGALAAAVEDMGATGAEAAEAARLLLDDAPTDAAGRLETVQALHELIIETRGDVEAIDLGPERALISPLASRRQAADAELGAAVDRLRRAERTTEVVRDLLTGPRRYLLLAANNAEMRSGSGAFLSAAVLETTGGTFTLGPTRSTAELLLPGAGAPLQGDLLERWGFTGLNREWRNLGASPRFDVTAPLAAEMWAMATGERVDGVLAVDVAALAAILEATGPVETDDGRRLDSESVVEYLLHDQYDVFAGGERSDLQRERRDELGRIAELTTERIGAGDFDGRTFGQRLVEAARGRHLLVWAADADAQQAWVDAGVAGQLAPDSLMVSLINRGGNKLDRFLRTEVALTNEPVPEGTRFQLDISLWNRVGRREVPYVAGPAAGVAGEPGDYIGFVAVNVPGAGRDLSFEGGPTVAAGPDGPTRVIAGQIRLPRGQRTTVTVRFTVPSDAGTLQVEPSARIPASRWEVGGRRFADGDPRTLRW